MGEASDFQPYRDAVEKLRAGGSLEYELNLACWLGERAHRLLAAIDELTVRLAGAETAYSRLNDEICQTLGKALGYPWFKDDQANFPGSTEAHGVCVGDHVAESIAAEAAKVIVGLRERFAAGGDAD